MDAFLTGALSSIPQLGALAGMSFLVILLLRREGNELGRERSEHVEDLKRRDDEIVTLRAKMRELDVEIDEQRRLRRAAEDAAARHRTAG